MTILKVVGSVFIFSWDLEWDFAFVVFGLRHISHLKSLLLKMRLGPKSPGAVLQLVSILGTERVVVSFEFRRWCRVVRFYLYQSTRQSPIKIRAVHQVPKALMVAYGGSF